MMWRSRKALDLQRDPRCTVHSTVADREGSEREFKLYGRAEEVHDRRGRVRYRDALYKRIGWKPEEPEYHLFSVDIESAAYVGFEDGERELERRVTAGIMLFNYSQWCSLTWP